MTRMIYLLAIACAVVQTLAARECKSADGSKTFDAEFIRYNAITDKVTLRVNNTKNMVMPAKAFSDDDQKFFLEEQKKIDMKEAVSVKIDRNSRTEREEDAKGNKTATKNTTFNFVIKNNSSSTLDGMKLKYWVLVQHKKGTEEDMEVLADEAAVGSLAPGEEATIKGPTVSLKEQKGGKGGKDKKQEDDIYGAKYELLSPAGEVMSTASSANRVDNYFNR